LDSSNGSWKGWYGQVRRETKIKVQSLGSNELVVLEVELHVATKRLEGFGS
jgi:hypothetical protein